MDSYGQVAGITETDIGTQPQDVSSTSANSVTVSQAFGFFNILVGLMLVAAFLCFFGGLTAYLTRLGLESRIQGLRYMYWGCTILFVLIVLLALVHYLQFHPTVIFIIVAVVLVILVAWVAISASRAGGDEEDEH